MINSKVEVKHDNAVQVSRFDADPKMIWLDLHLRDEDALAFVALSPKQARKVAKLLKRAARKSGR